MARILACGAFLKNAACLLDTDAPGALLWSAQHGDLSDPAACKALEQSVRTLVARAGGRIDAVAHAIKLAELGAGELLVTSMDGDGTQAGYDLELTRAIADSVSVPVVASGGVGTLQHLVEGVTKGHASAVLAASIFHFGTYSIAEAHAALRAAGLPARA